MNILYNVRIGQSQVHRHLRIRYNDSADAESKAADAALQPLKRLIIPGKPWFENQMLLRSA